MNLPFLGRNKCHRKAASALCLLAILVFAGCVVSEDHRREKPRGAGLADFAGTYRNRTKSNDYVSLMGFLVPKLPPASSHEPDYRSVDTVRILIEGKTAHITFLIGGRVYHEVSYVAGKDFELSSGTVPLKTAVGASVTKGNAGRQGMEAMVPVPPAAGAGIGNSQLFLNQKGDIVVRVHQTLAIMVFMVAPVVSNTHNEYVFERLSDRH